MIRNELVAKILATHCTITPHLFVHLSDTSVKLFSTHLSSYSKTFTFVAKALLALPAKEHCACNSAFYAACYGTASSPSAAPKHCSVEFPPSDDGSAIRLMALQAVMHVFVRVVVESSVPAEAVCGGIRPDLSRDSRKLVPIKQAQSGAHVIMPRLDRRGSTS